MERIRGFRNKEKQQQKEKTKREGKGIIERGDGGEER